MRISDRNAKFSIENIFVANFSIFRRKGLSWFPTTIQKVIVNRFLFAIRLSGVQSRIKSDLNFSHANLTDGFRGFMRHAVFPPEAFQVLHLTVNLSRKTQKPRVGEH